MYGVSVAIQYWIWFRTSVSYRCSHQCVHWVVEIQISYICVKTITTQRYSWRICNYKYSMTWCLKRAIYVRKSRVIKTTYYKNALYLPIYSNLKSIKNVGSFIYSRNLALARWHLKCVCWVVELLFDCDFYFLLRDLIFWTREIILLGDL